MYNLSLPDDLAAQLSQRAKERGLTLIQFLERQAQQPSGNGRNGHAPLSPDRATALDSFIKSMHDWGQKHIPPGHEVDDSRSTIYDGRGE